MASFPNQIYIQTTNRCPARCDICPYPHTYAKKPREPMSPQVWGRIIEDVQSADYCGELGLYLHCDPFEDECFAQRVADVAKTKAYYIIATNAASLTDDILEALQRHPPMTIHFDVMSGDKDLYEKFMGLPFEDTMGKIRRIVDAMAGKTTLVINAPKRKGVDTKHGLTRERFPECHLNDAFYPTSRGGFLKHVSCTGLPSPFRTGKHHCDFPERVMCILANGDQLLCCMDWVGATVGPNVLRENMFTMWRSSKEIVDQFKRGDYTDNPVCRHCSREMGWLIKRDEEDQ